MSFMIPWYVYFRNGRYHATTSLLRKYLGDLLIASYLDVIQESGYDDGYVKEVEVRIFSSITHYYILYLW